MCEFKDILIGNCEDNAAGVTAEAHVIPNHQLDTLATTFAEDAVFFRAQDVAVDEYVIYMGQVYKCTTIHAAGVWDAANFTVVPNGNVLINGSHIPSTGNGFAKIELDDDESMLEFVSQGKKFNRSGKLTGKFFHPGSSIEASEFNHQCNIAGGVTMLVPLPNGKVVQIGTAKSPAEISGSWQSGTRANPDTRWLFEVSCYAKGVIYYEGAITPIP